MCEALGASRSGFYNWLKNKERGLTDLQQEREDLKIPVRQFFHQSMGTYGAPRVHKDMKAAGYDLSEKKVARLMAEMGLHASQPRKFMATTDSKHGLSVHPNLLQQQFNVEKPNQVWVSDMTYIYTHEGWLYLSVVLDLFARKVVGWETTDHMRAEGPLAALEMAILFRNPEPGLIHHSDRGSQYASNQYINTLAGIQAKVSMSRKGNPYDNACAESFFATLKKDCIHRQKFKTKAEAIQKINWFISTRYNPVRRHSHNGHLSPNQMEKLYEIIQKNTISPKRPILKSAFTLVDAL